MDAPKVVMSVCQGVGLGTVLIGVGMCVTRIIMIVIHVLGRLKHTKSR